LVHVSLDNVDSSDVREIVSHGTLRIDGTTDSFHRVMVEGRLKARR
jgi:hypothetical protein